MNILERLKLDHREVKALFSQLKELDVDSGPSRHSVFEEIFRILSAHNLAEEEILYSSLKFEKNAKPDILEATEVHHVERILLNELEALPKDHESWLPKARVLSDLLDHHIQMEETEIFGDARNLFDRDALLGLGIRFEVCKKSLLCSPRSVTVDGEAGTPGYEYTQYGAY